MSERGSSKGAIGSHLRYLVHKDGHEHDDRLVATLGTYPLIKAWDEREPHYRVIIAPERGDVLDMEILWETIYSEVCEQFGRFLYAGSIHEKLQSNGRLNKHAHVLFLDTMKVGASRIKKVFSTAAARAATLQFEDRGLSYMPNILHKFKNLDIRQFNKELYVGDQSLGIG